MEEKKTHIEIDEKSGLIEQVFDKDEEIPLEKQLWEKNPKRTQALKDLWYDELQKVIDEDKSPETAKKDLAFMMITNSLMDMIMECVPPEMALEVSYSIDNYIALGLVNKKYSVDIAEELEKAISQVKRKDYDSDDDFKRALEAIEDHWWSIGQPALGKRSASDAIIEMLSKYGLNE
ncbi:MAG: hypothetical protein WC067_02215 [Candidatus Methanomethylophilaceae archaeon]